jgi:hypothetical protein
MFRPARVFCLGLFSSAPALGAGCRWRYSRYYDHIKGSIGFPVKPLVFKRLRKRRAGDFLPFLLFDDLPQKLEWIFAQRRGYGNELNDIKPAFPAFVFGNIGLRRAQGGSNFHLREAIPLSCIDENLAEPLISFSKSRLHGRTPFTSTLWEIA